ncbi:hypothetical protein [Serratia ureilytica]|uniref:hypothetical protein n=1 Tax=Serratia ureilytica TaxID=300181 RepID=UPI001D194FD0|nr:hypothetical protein [Serratia ureilytica]MCC4107335.1 hypothetical protein [Serratia ureilytica]
MGAIRLIFTKTYCHFATNDAIGFTFPRHPVKIGAITKKNESVQLLAGKTVAAPKRTHRRASNTAALTALTNEPG